MSLSTRIAAGQRITATIRVECDAISTQGFTRLYLNQSANAAAHARSLSDKVSV